MSLSLEGYFEPFRENTIGRGQLFRFPSGEKEILYADWTASGRGYRPIENYLLNEIIPFFANTHTESTATGNAMTVAYEEAKAAIKNHVNANADDVLIFCGNGMTSAVNKLQRLLGVKVPEQWRGMVEGALEQDESSRPVVFVTSMEHHSNHISWLETIATVEIIALTEEGLVDLEHFKKLLRDYRSRKTKIAAVTACSNVTGIQTPYHEIAKLIHADGGLCFVDFAASAPYVLMDMHPEDAEARLDAIYFSMHKFLGGPGTPGVLIFNKSICTNTVPDHPGGGTVIYTNPWRSREYVTDLESREDGGTPGVLQAIKAEMCIRLKDTMGIENMLRRERQLVSLAVSRLSAMHSVTILQGNIRNRLGIISFIVEGAHHDLIVRLLNDRFGIQTRGGCSCAGPYGHHLLGVGRGRSYEIWRSIRRGDVSAKPGWVRLSLHPTMTDREVAFMMDAIETTALNWKAWAMDYGGKANEHVARDRVLVSYLK
jgi:selenocysteine lyase/cysteine desulfurase